MKSVTQINQVFVLMDPIKIIVTNSDATSITSSNSRYQLAANSTESTESKSLHDISHNHAQNNNVPKSKSGNRFNLPPLKLSTSEQNTFSVQNNDIGEDESERPLLSPLLNKSFVTSQSTTSLNSVKKVKILPSSSSSRIPTGMNNCDFYANGIFIRCDK